MVWIGRPDDEAQILKELEKNKFSMPAAGLELNFLTDETSYETKTVSDKGISIKVDKTIIKKMIFKMGGNEILFTTIPPTPTTEEEEEPKIN